MQMVKWEHANKVFKVNGKKLPKEYLDFCDSGFVDGKEMFRHIGNPPTYKGMPELLTKHGKEWRAVHPHPNGFLDAKEKAENILKVSFLEKHYAAVTGKTKKTKEPKKSFKTRTLAEAFIARFGSEVKPLKPKKTTAHDEESFDDFEENQGEAATALMTKEHEPLIIRKYTQYGFPLYIAMICGANLDNLDDVVLDFVDKNKAMLMSNSIQQKRNLCGLLTEHICKTYGRKAEGVAVLWYMDKMWVSSLFGDFMNHAPCKIELFTLLSIMPHV